MASRRTVLAAALTLGLLAADHRAPPSVPPVPFGGTTVLEPARVVPPDRPATGAPPRTAAPHGPELARTPTTRPLAPAPSPTTRVRTDPHLDGCDRDYGTPIQCLPWTFPPGVTDRCAWLRERGLAPIRVVGVDRHGLDTDHNGQACDSGDRRPGPGAPT